MSDAWVENLIQHVGTVSRFIDDALAQGGRVVVHDWVGLCSRLGW